MFQGSSGTLLNAFRNGEWHQSPMVREWLSQSPAQRVQQAERMLKLAAFVVDPALAERLRRQADSLLDAARSGGKDTYPTLPLDSARVHGEQRQEIVESDISYFRRRCSEERTAALQSRDPQTRKAHLELAERYEDLVRGMSTHDVTSDGDRVHG